MKSILTLSFVLLLFVSGHQLSGQQPQQTQPRSSDTEEQPAEAVRLSKVVADLYKQGKYDEALPQAKRVVEIEEATFGSADSRVAGALQNLAEIYIAKKASGTAVKTLERAVEIYNNSPGHDSIQAGNAMDRLVTVLCERGEFRKAGPLLERALHIREVSGTDDLKTAEILWTLAKVRVTEQQYKPAEHFFLRSLNLREKKLGPLHPDTIAAMKSFACFQPTTYEPGVSQSKRDSEFTDEEKAISARASCWLYDSDRDCAATFGKSPVKREGVKVLNGRAVKLPTPPYPSEARNARASGSIMIAVLIDEAGKVINAKSVCGGHPALVNAALAAARGAEFSPTQLDGKPVKVQGVVIYNFVAR